MKAKYQPTYANGISVKPHYSFKYSYRIDGYYNRSQLPRLKSSPALLSIKAKKRLTCALNWLIFKSPEHKTYCKIQKRTFKFKVNFITLTLSASQQHSDSYMTVHMLQPFLKWMQRKGATLYVWKAEIQDNGNIHYHITTNHYLHWRKIRNKWNSLQQKHGYLHRFFLKHEHHDPNSTDVHSVINTGKVIKYMQKYISKLDKYCKDQVNNLTATDNYYYKKNSYIDEDGKRCKRTVECKIWSCSQELNTQSLTITEEDKYYKEVNEYLKLHSQVTNTDHGQLITGYSSNDFDHVYKIISVTKLLNIVSFFENSLT